MRNINYFISDYIIKEQLKNSDIFLSEVNNNLYELLSEYYCNNIPLSIANNFSNIVFSDIIDENLKSHNYVELENKLYEKFKNDIIGFETYTGKEDKQSFIIQVNDINFKTNIDFLNTLSFYNYYVRSIDKQNNYIIIAPIFSTNVTDYVWDKCYGKGYYFTEKQNIKNILKTGIRCKVNVDVTNSSSNKIPNRFYMFASSQKIQNIDKQYLKEFITKLARYKETNINNIGCIQIDLNKFKNSNGRKIQWYNDNLMTEDEAVFAEQPIPAECLSEIELPKFVYECINESKGQPIDDQWINDEKPVQTKDGRQVIITKIDFKEVPNVIYGKVKMKDKLYEYEWQEDGICSKALDQMGNPKKPDQADNLVKAV